MELFADDAPLTVANFLHYVNDGDYDGTFIHRVVTSNSSTTGNPLAVAGGAYRYDGATDPIHIPTDPPVISEFSFSRPNLRGTIGMVKSSVTYDAKSDWYFNNTDNPFLDEILGGFAVFGRVLGNGMEIVDAIAALPRINAGGAFDLLPVRQPNPQFPQDLVYVNSITVPEQATFVYAAAALAGLLCISLRAGRAQYAPSLKRSL